MAPFLGILTEYCLVPPPGIEPGSPRCEKGKWDRFRGGALMPETEDSAADHAAVGAGQRRCRAVTSEWVAISTQPAKLARTLIISSPMMMALIRFRPVA